MVNFHSKLVKYIPKRNLNKVSVTAHKSKFSIKDFFSKCDQTRTFLRIWSHLLKKSLLENFIFCAVYDSKTLPVKNYSGKH